MAATKINAEFLLDMPKQHGAPCLVALGLQLLGVLLGDVLVAPLSGDMVGSWHGRCGNLQGPKSQWEDLRKEEVKR